MLQEPEEEAPVQGSCLCGEVAFALEEPLSSIELCHCAKCQKSYGAPFAATLYAKRAAFRWLRGEDSVATWDAPLEDAPPAYRHSFCRRCGSALPLLWDELPVVEVPVAALDGSVDARPAYQMFACQRLDWIDDASGLRWYERGAPIAEKVLRPLL